ncbi:MAG: MBL fold metallo-hydrolase [Butyricicoccus sp.]
MKIMMTCVGDIGTNCYLVYDEVSREGAIIDPGDNAPRLLQMIRDNNVQLKYILLTHAHFDHILAVGEIKRETGAQVVVNMEDEYLFNPDAALGAFGAYGRQLKNRFDFPGADIDAREGTEITFGGMTAYYYHTPGHTPGSSTIQIGENLFTGDTLFCRECGRCDLPGGDFPTMLRSLKRLHDMDGDFRVYPGHMSTSTLDAERRENPYMRQAVRA